MYAWVYERLCMYSVKNYVHAAQQWMFQMGHASKKINSHHFRSKTHAKNSMLELLSWSLRNVANESADRSGWWKSWYRPMLTKALTRLPMHVDTSRDSGDSADINLLYWCKYEQSDAAIPAQIKLGFGLRYPIGLDPYMIPNQSKEIWLLYHVR